MNMLYETMRSGVGTVIVVPASALDSMNLGAVGGIAALNTMAEQNKPDGRGPQSPNNTPPPTV